MGWTIRDSNPGENKGYLPKPSLLVLGLIQPLTQCVPRYFTGCKVAAVWCHSPSSSADVKMSSAIPLLTLYIFMAWTWRSFNFAATVDDQL